MWGMHGHSCIDDMDPKSTMKNYTAFLVLWGGQTLSALGTSILSFALGVWVFQRTGSVSDFGMTVLLGMLPFVVLSPFAGVLVDRWPRKRVMMICDIGAALCGLSLFAFLAREALELRHVYVLTLLGSVFASFHRLAYGASISVLVPEESVRGRANGLIQLGLAGSFVVGPLIAGLLLAAVGLRGVILIDCASFSVAVVSLAMVRFPELVADVSTPGKHFLKEFRQGLTHIRGHAALLPLLALVAFANFSIGFVQVLFTPMVLSTSTQTVLGVLVALGGAGMIVGSLATSTLGVPARAMRGVWIGLASGGVCMILGGLRPSVWLWGSSVFCYFVAISVISTCLQGIWQANVPPALQGRVFSVRDTISFASLPLAYVVSPLLAKHFFEPWMSARGLLAPTVGRWLGTGAGRGMALMFVVIGVVLMAVAMWVARLRSLGSMTSFVSDHVSPMHSVAVVEAAD